jgi:hypothetical protein
VQRSKVGCVGLLACAGLDLKCGYETWRTLSKMIRCRIAVLAKDKCKVQNKILDASMISQSDFDRKCYGSGSDRNKMVGNRSSLVRTAWHPLSCRESRREDSEVDGCAFDDVKKS